MIKVEIWSDIACPFCFIGKRRFEAALAQFDRKDQVVVTWRSFELDPSAKKNQGVSVYEHLAAKYGRDVEWAKQMNENLKQQATDTGIKFDFDRVVPTNTFDAHRLLHLATKNGKQKEAQERLFSAYFTEGKDVSDHSVLETIADQIGLEAGEAKRCLSSDEFANDVRQDEATAAAYGLRGVPAFVFNEKFLVSGAQPTEVFLGALNEL